MALRSSRGLTTNLALFSGLLQLLIPLGMDLLLTPGEHESNVGTNRSRGSASGRERRCRWKMRGDWVQSYVEHYNNVRLNSAVGYITPKDKIKMY